MGVVLSHILAEEEPLEVIVERFASRTCLLLKNVPPETHIDYLELHIDSKAELSTSGIDHKIVSKPGNLYLLVFKSPIGKYLAIDYIIANCICDLVWIMHTRMEFHFIAGCIYSSTFPQYIALLL